MKNYQLCTLWLGVVFCGGAWSVGGTLQGRRMHHPQSRLAGLKSALGPAVLVLVMCVAAAVELQPCVGESVQP